MNIYEESYYIVYPDYDFDAYDNGLNPTPHTANIDWDCEKLNFGSKPLTFISRNDDLDFLKKDYAIAFNVPNFVVTQKLKELLALGLYGCQFFPAMVQDKKNNVVEGLWALNTYEELDCIDFKRSKHFISDDGSTEIDGFPIEAEMENYRFREEVLDAIPEKERLIFQVENTSMGEIFVHQKVVDIFKKNNVNGINFFKVSEFEDGDQY